MQAGTTQLVGIAEPRNVGALAATPPEREQELEVVAQVGELCAQVCRVVHRGREDEAALDEEVARD